jgi:predicted helicase
VGDRQGDQSDRRDSRRRLIAIQAKHYDEQHWISKRDIDTFLSESGRAAIAERLLIGTTDRVASNALEVMAAQQKPVSRCLRSRLASALVQWPSSPYDLDSGHRHAANARRPHQEEALRAITVGLPHMTADGSSWPAAPGKR